MPHAEETGTEESGGNISCGPTVCLVLYTSHHECPERHGMNFNLIPFYKEENIKKLDNSSKATQLVRDTGGK